VEPDGSRAVANRRQVSSIWRANSFANSAASSSDSVEESGGPGAADGAVDVTGGEVVAC
jgi:hypothetical protein